MTVNYRITQRVSVSITATLLLAGSVFASKPDTGSLPSVRALIEHTGITAQLYSMPNLVAESSEQHAARCDSQSAGDYYPGFDAESIVYDLVSDFKNSYTRSIQPVERWYQSSLAKKIQSAEKTPVHPAALTSFLESPDYNRDRENLIGNIVDNLQIPRFIAILGTEVEYAGIVHSGCINVADASSKINSEQRLADITREDKNLTALLMRDDIIAETAYLYRDLSDKELAEFQTFTSSDTGREFYAALIDAFQQSLSLAGDRLTRSLQSDLQGAIDF